MKASDFYPSGAYNDPDAPYNQTDDYRTFKCPVCGESMDIDGDGYGDQFVCGLCGLKTESSNDPEEKAVSGCFEIQECCFCNKKTGLRLETAGLTRHRISCECGCSGPWSETRKGAITKWDACN